MEFRDNHKLLPSTFANGCICNHLNEIRSINFNYLKYNFNCNGTTLNVKPVNIKIKNR